MLKRTTAYRASVYCAVTGVIAGLLGTVAVVWACETPVYRYAMYRWQPAPYEVYFLRDAAASETQQQMFQQLAGMSRNKELPANVLAFDVNLAEPDALDRVPADVKRAWLERQDKTTPACLVTSPIGFHVHTDSLEAIDVQQLVDSPVRQALSTQLAQGKAGVFLMLQATDPSANQAARQLLKEVIADIASGKLSLYSAPTDAAAAGSAASAAETGTKPVDASPSEPAGQPKVGTDDGSKADQPDDPPADQPGADNTQSRDAAEEPSASSKDAAPRLEIGFLEVQRDDPLEQWLIRSLLAVEDDLAGFSEPMVFAVYGRARVLPPFIGKGISRQNLTECVEFITGACSCTIKDQNPGVDLLVRFDWDSAAATLAEKVGAEEGNEGQFGGDGFFPELIVPSSGKPAGSSPLAGAKVGTDGGASAATSTDDAPATEQQPAGGDETTAEARNAPADPDGSSEAKNPSDPKGPSQVARATDSDSDQSAALPSSRAGNPRPPTPAEALHDEVSGVSMILVGGGLAVALLGLFVATFVVLRPR